MENRIREAFASIRADNALVEGTAAALCRRMAAPRRKPVVFPGRRLAGAFAGAFLLVAGLAGYRFWFTVDSHISIDVNPSVELSLNRLDRVVGTYAFNPEGEQLLSQLSLRGKRYGDAAGELISSMERSGYFQEEALVSITIQAGSRQKEQILYDVIQTQTPGIPAAATEVMVVSEEVRQSAHACHVSPAKYLAIAELMEVDPGATWEEYGHHSISQIRMRTQTWQAEHAHEGGAGGQGPGGRHGNGGRHHR